MTGPEVCFVVNLGAGLGRSVASVLSVGSRLTFFLVPRGRRRVCRPLSLHSPGREPIEVVPFPPSPFAASDGYVVEHSMPQVYGSDKEREHNRKKERQKQTGEARQGGGSFFYCLVYFMLSGAHVKLSS